MDEDHAHTAPNPWHILTGHNLRVIQCDVLQEQGNQNSREYSRTTAVSSIMNKSIPDPATSMRITATQAYRLTIGRIVALAVDPTRPLRTKSVIRVRVEDGAPGLFDARDISDSSLLAG